MIEQNKLIGWINVNVGDVRPLKQSYINSQCVYIFYYFLENESKNGLFKVHICTL